MMDAEIDDDWVQRGLSRLWEIQDTLAAIPRKDYGPDPLRGTESSGKYEAGSPAGWCEHTSRRGCMCAEAWRDHRDWDDVKAESLWPEWTADPEADGPVGKRRHVQPGPERPAWVNRGLRGIASVREVLDAAGLRR